MAKILYFVTDTDTMAIELALKHKGHEVGICLLQDAVYFGCKGKKNELITETIKRGIPVFAAKKDIELRDLAKLLQPEIKTVDYSDIIDLVLKYERTINL